eukprot:5687702-Alexandrium_andersonii.AAC.1
MAGAKVKATGARLEPTARTQRARHLGAARTERQRARAYARKHSAHTSAPGARQVNAPPPTRHPQPGPSRAEEGERSRGATRPCLRSGPQRPS